jgi:uncharacterized protein YecE (DUF72 family)
MSDMIWIGTSGWVYPHWVGHFYPPELPARDHLAFYAQRFPTVEINRSFYRLPTRDQFRSWTEQTAARPGFLFAVKASRYISHLKKLRGVDEALDRFIDAAAGLGERLGPCLYQLPPHWRADPLRLEQFVARLPRQYRAAFEFRDPSWYRPEIARILADAGCALVIAVGGSLSSPPDAPQVGPFGYVRFHHGAHGIGFSRTELAQWAQRLAGYAGEGRDAYAYFNNDPDGHAVADACTLRELLGPAAVQPS